MVWHSKKYRDEALARQAAAAGYDRIVLPRGRAASAGRDLRQRTVAPRRSPRSTCPTLVIHGRDDTLITPSGGMRTAELIDGAHLLLVADMGHDLPEPLWPLLVDAITSHARHAALTLGAMTSAAMGRATNGRMAGPLAGYRIIEIAGIGPGPFAAMMLADMGAEVIRVERAQSVRGPAPDTPARRRARCAAGATSPST